MGNENTRKTHRRKRWIPVYSIAGVFVAIFVYLRLFYSIEVITKRALKKEYNESFVIHEIDAWGFDWEATVSPVNLPDVVFKTRILPTGEVEDSAYFQEYVNYLLEELLANDIQEFFPDSCIEMERTCLRWEGDSSFDFRNMNIEEIMDHSEAYEGPIFSGCYLNIYVNKNVGSTKEYEKEYEFFTNTIDEYVEEKKMLPVTVTIYYITPGAVQKIEEYLKKDADRDRIFEKQIAGEDRIETGITEPGRSELGNPPNITVCFKKDKDLFVDSFDEYKRRRELLENAP